MQVSLTPPLHVLTGFLGSGKTTVLNRLLQQPALASTAVLINEFGAAGIDHLVVENIDEEIVVLESGCVCCDLRDDLGATLRNLCSRRDAGELPAFERVVLETTGIADPGAIIQMLVADDFFCASFRVGNVIAVVDALYCGEQLQSHEETARQIAVADRIVLSKCDLADAGLRALARDAVAAINPSAPVMESPGTEMDRILDREGDDAAAAAVVRAAALPAPGHIHSYGTFRLAWDEAVSWEDLEDWLNGLLIARGEDILRLKGIANVAGEPGPLLVQGVRHSLFAPARLQRWPLGRPRTDFVFITRHFSATAAARSLKPFFEVNASAA